ncbi:hypothetical protein [Streptomyces sp. NPDC001604]|uniref:hypothetical protein n=1 Tax=Streptomyces sp. NPDC001604 TaxID=3364593 RepID=UPI0036A260DF
MLLVTTGELVTRAAAARRAAARRAAARRAAARRAVAARGFDSGRLSHLACSVALAP